jgi:tryptophan-rich sensory protein
MKDILGLIGWIAISFVAAGLGGAASVNAPEFYQELTLPAWAPPAWVFGPVWTALYLMMAIAAWLVWRERGFAGAKLALTLFLVQLAANALWTWLFFGWQQGLWSSVDIVLLWGLIVATVIAFWRVKPLAGALLIPYLAWVSFAAVLNVVIWRTNPQLLG